MKNKTYFCNENHNLIDSCRDETNCEVIAIKENYGVHLLSAGHPPFPGCDVVFLK